MANQLDFKIRIDDSILQDLKKIGQEFKRFFADVKKELNLNFNVKGAFQGGGGELSKLTSEINKIQTAIKQSTTQIEKAVQEIPKAIDNVLKDVFVGFDRVFNFFNRFRLRLGGFLGDSRATLLIIINQVVRLAQDVLPKVLGFVDSINRLANQAASFANRPEFKNLQQFLESRQVPLILRIEIFFIKVQAFFVEAVQKLNEIVGVIRFVFNISDREFSKIQQRASKGTENFTKNLDKTEKSVIDLFNKVDAQRRGLFARSLIGLGKFTLGTAGAIGKTATAPLRLVGEELGLLLTSNSRKINRQQEDIARRNEKRNSIQELQKRKQQEIFGANEKFKQSIGDVAKISGDLNKSATQILSTIKEINTTIKGTASKELEKTNMKFSDVLKQFDQVPLKVRQTQESLKGLSGAAGRGRAGTAFNIVPPEQKKELEDFQKRVTSVFTSLFLEFSKLEKTPRTVLNSIRGIFSSIEQGAGDSQKQFRNLQNVLFDAFIKDGKVINRAGANLASEFGKIFLDLKGKSVKSVQEVSKELPKNFNEAINQIEGKSLSLKVSKALSTGLRQGKPEAQKAAGEIAKVIAAFFPQSPAKLGPLKNIIKAGMLIPKQLSMGIMGNKKESMKAGEMIAKSVGDYFPQSLAKLGILKNLPASGKLIPAQLATGILSNLGQITNAAIKLSEVIFAPIKAVLRKIKDAGIGIKNTVQEVIQSGAQIGDISNVTGVAVDEIAELDGIFRSVGERASNNVFTFTRLQQTLNEFNPDRERKLAKIGIDLDEIRQKGKPTIELFKAVADTIKDLPPGSQEAKVAIEALGLTAQSKLIGVLRQGSEEIQRISETAKNFSGAFNQDLVNTSLELRNIFGALSLVSDALKNDFIGQFLPEIKNFFQEILNFFNSNAPKIRGFFLFLGNAVKNLIAVGKEFFILLANEPSKAFRVIVEIAVITFRTLGELVDNLFARIRQNITAELQIRFQAALTGIRGAASNLFTLIFEQIDLRIAKLLLLVEDFFLNLDTFVVGFSNKFLSRTTEVGSRWFKIATAVVTEFFVSIFDFVENTRDRVQIFLLESKRGFIQTFADIASSESFQLVFGKTSGEDLKRDIRAINLEISTLNKDIDRRNAKGNFLDRALAGIDKVAADIKTVDELLDEVNEEISKSNAKFFEESKKNFKVAFEDAQKLIDATKEATEGLFDQKAIDTYTASLKKASEEIKKAVSDTNLKEPLSKLLDELTAETLTKFQNLAKDAPSPIEGTSEEAKEGNQNLLGLIDTFKTAQTATSNISGTFNALFSGIAKQSKAAALAVKSASLLEAIVRTASAVTAALNLPFPLNITQAALVAAQGGAQVGSILAAGLQGFQQGGVIPGTGRGDKVPILAEPGEFMIPLDIVRQNGVAFFEAIKNGVIGIKDFAAGAFSGASANRQSKSNFQNGSLIQPIGGSLKSANGTNGQQVKPEDKVNVINIPDFEGGFERVISGKKGEGMFLNFISANQVQIKRRLGIQG